MLHGDDELRGLVSFLYAFLRDRVTSSIDELKNAFNAYKLPYITPRTMHKHVKVRQIRTASLQNVIDSSSFCTNAAVCNTLDVNPERRSAPKIIFTVFQPLWEARLVYFPTPNVPTLALTQNLFLLSLVGRSLRLAHHDCRVSRTCQNPATERGGRAYAKMLSRASKIPNAALSVMTLPPVKAPISTIRQVLR